MKLSTQPSCQLFSSPASLWLIYLLTLFSSIVSAFGQQPTGKQPESQGGPGRHLSPAVKVAFKPGPFGPDGKVQPVKPERMKSAPSEHETPQVEEARALAEAGIYTLTTKPHAVSLSAQQFSLLHWKPNSLNVADNPILASELIKPPVPADKRIVESSTPQHGPDFAGIGATGLSPPDGGVAAGPLQVLEVVNSSINVYDKTGTLLSSQTLNSFFGWLGTPGTDFIYDPSI